MGVYINRAMEKTVLAMNNRFPVLLITGPRQAGKTTMLRKLSNEKRR